MDCPKCGLSNMPGSVICFQCGVDFKKKEKPTINIHPPRAKKSGLKKGIVRYSKKKINFTKHLSSPFISAAMLFIVISILFLIAGHYFIFITSYYDWQKPPIKKGKTLIVKINSYNKNQPKKFDYILYDSNEDQALSRYTLRLKNIPLEVIGLPNEQINVEENKREYLLKSDEYLLFGCLIYRSKNYPIIKIIKISEIKDKIKGKIIQPF